MAVYRLSGETPFKIVGSNFVIGPAESEYTLAFSPNIDGEYTLLPISCPAGEGNAVVGCPMACYWKLINNIGEVIINS